MPWSKVDTSKADPNIKRKPGVPAGAVARNAQLRSSPYKEGRQRRDKFVEILKADPGAKMEVLLAAVGVGRSTYTRWRAVYPEFRWEVDAIRGANTTSPAGEWTAGFASFRKQFFGFDSPWFHLAIVEALEQGAPGSITLILIPPEHGKTTLLTDYQCFKYAQDPSFRVTYASEKQGHAVKVGRRIRDRMIPYGTARAFVLRFGPFEPGSGQTTQPWGNQFFNVRKKAEHDDQEYSWQAVGFGAAIAGTRSDLLIVDDVQSRKSIGMTKKILEEFRQDWLSRPGAKGRTVVIGTRVGDDDFYQALMDDYDEETGRALVDRIIKFPAVRRDFDTGEDLYLWPERYSPEEYENLRIKAGPAAWARNYQQNPKDSGEDTFTDDVRAKMVDELYAWEMPIPNDVKELAISLDPAVGGHNAFTVQGWAPTRMIVLEASGQWGLTSYDQIWTALEQLLDHWTHRTRADGLRLPVTTFIVEDKAFQHGLLRDAGLLALQGRYGFIIVPHQTGSEKNDEIIGITGMVRSARMGEIVIPYASDSTTKARTWPLVDELRKWRPFKRGNRLRQDKVMALWFGWMRWRRNRDILEEPSEHERGPMGRALPWAPMKPVHLINPAHSASPFQRLVRNR